MAKAYTKAEAKLMLTHEKLVHEIQQQQLRELPGRIKKTEELIVYWCDYLDKKKWRRK